jgi:dTDP-glucose 4,6-dehydratase
MYTNITGTLVMLQAARECKIKRFVQVSTDEVYGEITAGESADENAPLKPNNPYAASKAAADLLVRSFIRTYHSPGLIVRSSNNYGPYQFPEKFLPQMISNAMQHKALPLYGDGLHQREWIHVDDNCRAIATVLEKGAEGEIYNAGSGEIRTNLEMAQCILSALGKSDALIQHVEDRPGHDRRYSLNSGKLEGDLGWKPQVRLDDGLRRTLEWYRNNQDWLRAVKTGDYLAYYDKNYVHRAESLEHL